MMKKVVFQGMIFAFAGMLILTSSIASAGHKKDVGMTKMADMFLNNSRGSVNIGDIAPDFTNPIVPDPQTFTLYDFTGYVVLINLWTNT